MAAHRVIATIPVFRPPSDLGARVRDLLTQVDRVVLVDDGSHSVRDVDIDDDRVIRIDGEENLGIAHALNVAIAEARSLGATHVLTLDQDSAVAEGYVARFLAALDDPARAGQRIAAAVPEIVGGAAVLRDGDDWAFDPIQSGQLVPMTVLDEVGGFDERLFIDAVDSDFTLRAHARGYRFLIVAGERMGHDLGELVPITFFGRQLVLAGRPRHVLYHRPFRTYYMVRNSVHLVREHGRADRAWMWLRVRKMIEMVAGCAILAPDRAAQVRAVRAGLRDGRRGTLGRIDDGTLRAIEKRRA